MKIDMQASNFRLTWALRRFIRKRVNSAVGGHSGKVDAIQVRLSDINGPRGGQDKRCVIRISLPSMRDVLIHETRKDMYEAISRATERAKNTVVRRVKKQARHQTGALPIPA